MDTLFFVSLFTYQRDKLMSNLFLRGWNWICRFRHRCGYGVHSPSDFFLITFVVYEHLPFYAYKVLHDKRKLVDGLPHYREKTDKLLLRLVNHLQPASILEIGTGSGLASLYLSEGKHCPLYTMDEGESNPKVGQMLERYPSITYRCGDIRALLHTYLKEQPGLNLVHIAHTSYYKEIFEMLLPYVSSQTCFLIALPYATKEKKLWWRQVIDDPRTGVTFDLYDIGLVFFDQRRIKEHRMVNFL